MVSGFSIENPGILMYDKTHGIPAARDATIRTLIHEREYTASTLDL